MVLKIGHKLGLEHPWEHPTYGFLDEKEFSRYKVMTGKEWSANGVYRLNEEDYTVTHAPMVMI